MARLGCDLHGWNLPFQASQYTQLAEELDFGDFEGTHVTEPTHHGVKVWQLSLLFMFLTFSVFNVIVYFVIY